MNYIKEFLIILNKGIFKLSKLIRNVLYSLYKYIIFIFNKRKTIKKMYESIIISKEKENKSLLVELKGLQNKEAFINKKIKTIEADMTSLEEKINYIEKYFLN